MTATTRRRVWTIAIVVVAILALLYGGRVAVQFMGATEGDVPSASDIPLPDGATIVGESRDCGSGGCWVTFSVRPPPGQSPAELAQELGATPQLEIPGTFLDPRTTWLTAEPKTDVLSVQADYFSQRWTP